MNSVLLEDHLGLQWGRTQLSAEIRLEGERCRTITWRLQWGRTQLSAEIRCSRYAFSSPTGPLQWGRTQLSAEIKFAGSVGRLE